MRIYILIVRTYTTRAYDSTLSKTTARRRPIRVVPKPYRMRCVARGRGRRGYLYTNNTIYGWTIVSGTNTSVCRASGFETNQINRSYSEEKHKTNRYLPEKPCSPATYVNICPIDSYVNTVARVYVLLYDLYTNSTINGST